MYMSQSKCLLNTLLLSALGFALTGCETKAQSGALIGSAAGAGLGAIIGHQSGHAGAGALIGGAVGAGGGYIAGNEMDKKDQRERDAYDRSTRTSRENRYPEEPAPRSSSTLTKNQVVRWTQDGVKDDIIIDRIDRSGATFRLSVADENDLRDAGVSEEVVRAMKNTARK
jgi:uncharacterized protein YcfJ